MSDLVASLWITLIGMGLVFIGILLLWGLMEAVVRITARFAERESEKESETEAFSPSESVAPLPAPAFTQKRRAAAAAVAIAMALRKPAARLSLPQNSALSSAKGTSAWLSLTRASQLNHPTQIARKSRGSAR